MKISVSLYLEAQRAKVLAHSQARLAGGVRDVAQGEAGSLKPFDSLAGALDRLVADVERPVQVHQKSHDMHAPMIASTPGWGSVAQLFGVCFKGPQGLTRADAGEAGSWS